MQQEGIVRIEAFNVEPNTSAADLSACLDASRSRPHSALSSFFGQSFQSFHDASLLTRGGRKLSITRKTASFTQDPQGGAAAGAQAGDTAGGTLSTAAATLNLFLIMIGSSVLSFPSLFSHTGLVLSPWLLCVSGVVSVAMCLMETAAIQSAKQGSVEAIETLEDVGQFYLGTLGRYAARLVQNVSFVGDIMCFMVLIGNNLNYLFPALAYKEWVGVVAVCALSTVFLRDAAILENLSVIGYIAPPVYLVAIVGGSMKGMSEETAASVVYAVWDLKEIISVLTTMLFAFGPCDVVPTLLNEMRHPEEFPKALVSSHIMVALMYAAMGLCGYVGFGSQAEGNAVLSMCDSPGCPGGAAVAGGAAPGGKWVFGYGLAAVAVANHSAGLLINLLCIFMNLEAILSRTRPVGRAASTAVRVAVVLLSGLFGAALPFFDVVLGFISAIVAVPLVVIFPTAISYMSRRMTGMPARLKLLHGLLIVFALLCLWVSIEAATEKMLNRLGNRIREAPPEDADGGFGLSLRHPPGDTASVSS